MGKKGKNKFTKRAEIHTDWKNSRSVRLAKNPIRTGQQFANLMASLISDLAEHKVSPSVGNAICNAGGKMLKVIELQTKYGRPDPKMPGAKQLLLTSGNDGG